MPPRHSYRVTDVITDQTRGDKAGNVVTGNLVYYETGRGNQGVVFVDTTRWTKEHVKHAIRPSARLIDEIADLADEFD